MFFRNPVQPKGTTTLYNVICSITSPSLLPEEKIEAARGLIFDFDYKTPDNIDEKDFKEFFEKSFIYKYIDRYIAPETYELFKLKLKSLMYIKMNDYSRKMSLFYKKDFDGGNVSETTTERKNKNIGADLPVGIIKADNINSVSTASRGDMSEDSGTTTQKNYSVSDVIKSSDYFNDLFTSLIDEFEPLFSSIIFI